MDISNPNGRLYCLPNFDKFVLRSAQLNDQTAALFKFTDPGTALQNPTIELIAEANKLVATPTCKLSNTMNGGTYQSYCDITLEVEAFIGTLSFGVYTQFVFRVFNECYTPSLVTWNQSPS